MKGKSLRKSINEKCRDCIYDPLAGGTWLKQVELCTSKSCPLYDVRPLPRNPDKSTGKASKNRLEGNICVVCDGTGWCEGSPAYTCPTCKGTGEHA